MMKDKMTETVDALLGFDSDELQRRMTDGLAEWMHRRKEAARTRRLCVPALCVMLAVAGASYWLSPVFDYNLAEGVEYEEVAMINNNILGR